MRGRHVLRVFACTSFTVTFLKPDLCRSIALCCAVMGFFFVACAERQHVGFQSTGARDVRANLGPNICPRSLHREGLSRHEAACSHIHHRNFQAGLAHKHSCATWCHERNRHWCETERRLACHSPDCSNDRGGAAGMASSVSGISWAAGRPGVFRGPRPRGGPQGLGRHLAWSPRRSRK